MDVLLHNHKAKDICHVPDGLRELCADISREVIRAQPEDIFYFVCGYLNTLLLTRENAKVAVDLVQSVMCQSEQIVEILSSTGLDMKHIAAVAPRLKGAFKSYADAIEPRKPCGCAEDDKPPAKECGCPEEEIEISKKECGCDVEEPPKKTCGCDESVASDVCSIYKKNYCVKTSCLEPTKKDCGCDDDSGNAEKLSGCDELPTKDCGCDDDDDNLQQKLPGCDEPSQKDCGCNDNEALQGCNDTDFIEINEKEEKDVLVKADKDNAEQTKDPSVVDCMEATDCESKSTAV